VAAEDELAVAVGPHRVEAVLQPEGVGLCGHVGRVGTEV
jgi:hypothetical protein